MPAHFAVFGKTPALSAAELFAVLGPRGLKLSRVAAAGMIFGTDVPLSPDFWNGLGGTVKAGVIIATFKGDAETAAVRDRIVEDVASRLPDGRAVFGVSVYRLDQTVDGRRWAVGPAVKKALIAAGRSARHVTSRDAQLSAVTVRKNGLLGKGVEYCLFADRASVSIGVTEWVQDYEEFAVREFGRPAADARSGLLPVKLARGLLNLAGVPLSATVLDPFCGSGTIVAEALAAGYAKVLASDLEERAVRETRENCEWIRGRMGAKGRLRLELGPAERVDLTFRGEGVDAVATEPYLGPPLKGNEPEARLAAVRAELATTYEETFAALVRLLAAGTPVVFLLPIHRQGDRRAFVEVLPAIEKMGFTREPLIPERYAHTPGFGLSPRGGVVYRRPGQFVEREIFRFRKR